MTERVRFSINLDEDFALYGIDPNENLDDWSFLDAKPEPIPEKTEEERKLFEQLLQPTINEDDIENEIHGRLRKLLNDTSELIKSNENDPLLKEKIRESLEKRGSDKGKETTEDHNDERINTPEYQQANRVRNIVKNLLRSTEKAEDISDFINNITKSDNIPLESINVDDNQYSIPSARLLPKVTENEEAEPEDSPNNDEVKQPKANTSETVEKDNARELPKMVKETSFFSKYFRTLIEPRSVLKELDETERLSTKFEEERKKREEEAKKEAERKRIELEERSKRFFETLQKEADRRDREIRMVEHIKNSKPTSVSEMLSNIRGETNKPVDADQSDKTNEAKPKKPIVQEIEKLKSTDEIARFYEIRNQKFKELTPKQSNVLVVELLSEKQKPIKTKPHESKTFLNNINKSLKELLITALSKKKSGKNGTSLVKIAVFLLYAHRISLAKRSRLFLTKFMFKKWTAKYKRSLDIKRQKDELRKMKEELRKQQDDMKKKQDEIRKKKDEEAAQIRKQEEYEEYAKNSDEVDLLNNVRKIINQRFPDKKKRDHDPSLAVDIPEIDSNWLDKYADDDSDLVEFLQNLKDNIEEHTERKPIQDSITYHLDSKSVPISVNKDSQELGEEDIRRAHEALKKRLEKNKISKTNDPKGSLNPDSKAPQEATQNVRRKPNNNNDEETGEDDKLIRKAKEEGFDSLNPETIALMKAAQKRRVGNKYKNEKPIDRFKRLFGFNAGNPPTEHDKIPPREKMMFRGNDNKKRRLRKLQQAWFDGEREAQRQRRENGDE